MAIRVKTQIKIGSCDKDLREHYISNLKGHLKFGRWSLFRHLMKEANRSGCKDITIGEISGIGAF